MMAGQKGNTMTLYELCDNITIQGNIELKVFDSEGTEFDSHFFREEYEFHITYTAYTELEDLQVSYMYTTKSYDGTVWLVIEVTKEEEE
jgi:hypothetical protein